MGYIGACFLLVPCGFDVELHEYAYYASTTYLTTRVVGGCTEVFELNCACTIVSHSYLSLSLSLSLSLFLSLTVRLCTSSRSRRSPPPLQTRAMTSTALTALCAPPPSRSTPPAPSRSPTLAWPLRRGAAQACEFANYGGQQRGEGRVQIAVACTERCM